jgi:carboxypeptidase family protein
MELARFYPLLFAAAALPLMGGSIGGRVTDNVTGAGIARVEVTFVMPPNLESGATAVTDDSGVFRIANIPDGQYLPLLKKDGFVMARAAVIGNMVRIAGDTRMDLGMTRLTTLRGRVIDPEKKTAAGITVQVQMMDSLLGLQRPRTRMAHL